MLTREQFQIIYDQGPDAVFELVSALQKNQLLLEARIQALEERLNKDSHNSNKPPSSDGLGKKPTPQSLRQKTGRPQGGQKGHPGKTLTLVEKPDTVVEHAPSHCRECGMDLASLTGVSQAKRQVFDLPPLRLQVTEHRRLCKVCPDCGQTNQGMFPSDVTQSTQYGPRVKALGVYLSSYQLLPYARIAQLFADLFDAPLSVGTLVNAQEEASAQIAEPLSTIRQGLLRSPVVHFDETGLRISGSLHWLHSASTSMLTYYACDKKRGKVGMDNAGILPSFAGIAVHDGWESYRGYECSHALCNAHHLRELTAISEQGNQEWAKEMRRLLVEMKQAVERAPAELRTRVHPVLEARFEARYRQCLEAGFAANPPPEVLPGKRGRPKQGPARNLLERLKRDMGATLRFLYDFRVPFDNNQAERDVRMMKLQQKVSGCFRSTEGAKIFCRLRSYLSTMRKQGQQLLTTLEQVFQRKPVMPACLASK